MHQNENSGIITLINWIGGLPVETKVTINREPCWLLEAAELVYGLVNEIPAEKLAGTGPYCLPVAEVEKLLAFARRMPELQDRQLRFYFHAVPLERQSLRDSCLASVLLYTPMEVSCSDPAQMVQMSIDIWSRWRSGGLRIKDMNGFSLNLKYAEESTFVSLAEELSCLPVPKSYQVELAEVLSDYSFHIANLARLLEPVTSRLPELMAPWVTGAAELLDSWERFFRQHSPGEYLEQRGSLQFGGVREFNMALRYLSPQLAPAVIGVKMRVHMGIDQPVGFDPASITHDMEEWEYKALQLLSSVSRVAMLRMMMNQSMSVQMIAKALNLNPGAVSRDVGGLHECKLLHLEVRDGRSFYRTNPKTLSQVTEHVCRYITQS